MGLTKTVTVSRRVVLSMDTALVDIDQGEVAEYLKTRDLSLIEEQLKSAKDRPVIFSVRPMLVDVERLSTSDDPLLMREFVRRHIEAVEGLDGGMRMTHIDGLPVPTEAAINELPLDYIRELRDYIIEAQRSAGGLYDFFSLPDTWRTARRNIELARLRAEISKKG